MTTKSGNTDMPLKQLGNSDLFITPVGFGAWAIGGDGWEFGWGDQDDKASVAAIHRATRMRNVRIARCDSSRDNGTRPRTAL